ncbi:type IV toxin-antitoxin system AbiEi family antitoxin domain-containing protein [Kitasatospora sp. NPDC001574]
MTHPRDRIPPPGLITTAQLGALGVPPDVVRNWVRHGRLRRAGGSQRYPWYRTEDTIALVEAYVPRPQKSA